MRHYYLDSSVAVRILFGHSATAAAWFDAATADPDSLIVSSRLLRTELTRVLRREGVDVMLRDVIVDYVGTIAIDDAVLAEAEAIVPHVKTLDAIHLASLVRTGIDATVVTHDDTMRRTAEQLGYAVLDPVEAA